MFRFGLCVCFLRKFFQFFSFASSEKSMFPVSRFSFCQVLISYVNYLLKSTLVVDNDRQCRMHKRTQSLSVLQS